MTIAQDCHVRISCIVKGFPEEIFGGFYGRFCFPVCLGVTGVACYVLKFSLAREFLESVGCKQGSVVTNNLIRTSVSCEVILQIEDHCFTRLLSESPMTQIDD